MKTLLIRLMLWLAATMPSGLLAQETVAPPAPAPVSWHAQSLWEAVGYMLLFAAIGIVVAVIGYKVFDRCTPGHLHREIIENKNVAAALVAAAVILGLCIIVAAAMIG
jgi:uncharacterized membrane protein YjfL (UPF0719 family)